jgi:hypothetical protein
MPPSTRTRSRPAHAEGDQLSGHRGGHLGGPVQHAVPAASATVVRRRSRPSRGWSCGTAPSSATATWPTACR